MKYIIYCNPGIGDAAIIMPALQLIKEKDRKAFTKIIMLSDKDTFKSKKDLLELQGAADAIDYYNKSELVRTINFICKLGWKEYDYGIYVSYVDIKNGTKVPYYFLKFASKKICGLDSPNAGFKFDIEIRRKPQHAMFQYYLEILEQIGLVGNVDYQHLIKQNKINCIKKPNDRPVITLCLGTGKTITRENGKIVAEDFRKGWSYDNWIHLIKKFSINGYAVYLLGGKKEQIELERMEGYQIDNRIVHNLVGRNSLLESLSVISSSDLVIGADTGLMHCAAAINTPNLTLFGPTDYKEYKPFGNTSYHLCAHVKCSPCFGTAHMKCDNFMCMGDISVEMVFDFAVKILEQEKCLNKNEN